MISMTKISRLMIAGVVALTLVAATAFTHPRGGMGPMHWGGMMGGDAGTLLPMILRGVDLTPEQETRVHEIMQAHRATFRPLFSELKKAHEEMTARLFAPGEVRAEDLTAQLQRVEQLRSQLMQEGLKVALEVRSVLTPEQLAKAGAIKDRMNALHSEMRSLMKDKR
jgi:Spy/CpxP family protein refolding chaperone